MRRGGHPEVRDSQHPACYNVYARVGFCRCLQNSFGGFDQVQLGVCDESLREKQSHRCDTAQDGVGLVGRHTQVPSGLYALLHDNAIDEAVARVDFLCIDCHQAFHSRPRDDFRDLQANGLSIVRCPGSEE